MTREQIETEYRKLLSQRTRDVDAVYVKAEKEGRLRPGFDSNKELTRDIDEEFARKVKDLRNQLD